MRTTAVILAAGQGTRFGGDKSLMVLRGKPLWQYSYDAFRRHPGVDDVGIICSSSNIEQIGEVARDALFVEVGGPNRTESSRLAVQHAVCDRLLIHDGARPFVSAEVIDRVLVALDDQLAVAPAVPVTDTIRQIQKNRISTPDRSQLVAMQTPQGASHELIKRAYSESKGEFGDEMALLESIGIQPNLVAGDPRNFKVTTPDDLLRAASYLGPPEIRTGIGYDVHATSPDHGRKMVLGGVHFEGPGLEGHSDADVVMHACTDAVLGAVANGDIGQHFPNTDPTWANRDSRHFLTYAADLVRQSGWQVMNLDVSVVAEFPKVMPQALQIRQNLAECLGVETERVSVKATTNERLGSIGRGEGVAAFAVATLRQFP